MHVEREIAGITLPFTIGAIITVCTVKSFCAGGFVIHELAFAACFMSLCGLLLRKSRPDSPDPFRMQLRGAFRSCFGISYSFC